MAIEQRIETKKPIRGGDQPNRVLLINTFWNHSLDALLIDPGLNEETDLRHVMN